MENQKVVLQAFSRALGREAHVLSQHPDLLWQQPHNRLQWEDEPVRVLVAEQRDQRSLAACRPWLRTRTPFRESEALLRTLSGHTSSVTAVVFSPDGTRIVSASMDNTLKLWDVATGQELGTLPLHGSLNRKTLHPWKPFAAYGAGGGGFHLIELVGIEYGPIIVTAVEAEQGIEVRCPACQQDHPLRQEQLGSRLTCPTPGCGLHLKINPFVIHIKEYE